MIHPDSVTDNGCFTDYYARSMVNAEVLTYLGTGMNVNAGNRMIIFTYYSWKYRHIQLIEDMGNTVSEYSLKSRIAQNDLKYCPGGRITGVNGFGILVQLIDQDRDLIYYFISSGFIIRYQAF